jgi:hypothetical protein
MQFDPAAEPKAPASDTCADRASYPAQARPAPDRPADGAPGGRRPLARFDTFRENARDCIDLSKKYDEPETRALLLGMAQAWIRLADQVVVMTVASDMAQQRHEAPGDRSADAAAAYWAGRRQRRIDRNAA